jgi:hypothetical protein
MNIYISSAGKKYESAECSVLTKTLAEELKARVKELNFKR